MMVPQSAPFEPLQRRHRIRENLERLRSCAELDRSRRGRKTWRSIIELTDRELKRLQGLEVDPSEETLEKVARHFDLSPESLVTGKIDFHVIAARYVRDRSLPERYLQVAYSRLRTPITSFGFIEKTSGWRTRQRILRRLGASEANLVDPMGLISHRFITEVCEHLKAREGFSKTEFFRMGTHSFEGNRSSLLSRTLSSFSTPAMLYEVLFTEMTKLFEHNCRYVIQKSASGRCIVDVVQDDDIANAMGVRRLGNSSICELRAGIISSMTGYLNLPFAHIRHTLCLHRGDTVCRYEISHPSQVETGDSR